MTERHFNEMITTHTELLANTAEGIRRELLPIAILKSNYSNEARKSHNKLEKINHVPDYYSKAWIQIHNDRQLISTYRDQEREKQWLYQESPSRPQTLQVSNMPVKWNSETDEAGRPACLGKDNNKILVR